MAKFNTLAMAVLPEQAARIPVGAADIAGHVLFANYLPDDDNYVVHSGLDGILVATSAARSALWDAVVLPFVYGMPAVDIEAVVRAIPNVLPNQTNFALAFYNADGGLVAEYALGGVLSFEVDIAGLMFIIERRERFFPTHTGFQVRYFDAALASAVMRPTDLAAALFSGFPLAQTVPVVPAELEAPFSFWASLEDSYFTPEALAIAVDGTATSQAEETLRIQARHDERFRRFTRFEVGGVAYDLDGLTRVDRGLSELSLKRVVNV